MTPLAALQHIASRLADTPPIDLINELAPRLRSDAVIWAGRLPSWDEYAGEVSSQAIAIARTVSRRAMREFNLEINRHGRVAEKQAPSGWRDELVSRFPMRIGEETIEVRLSEYPAGMWVSFVGQALPAENAPSLMNSRRRHSLSQTGWWSCHVPPDAITAVGGEEVFAALLAEAKIAGHEEEFIGQFEGKRQEVEDNRKKPKRVAVDRPVLGDHTAALAEERQAPEAGKPLPAEEPTRQGELF